MKKLFTYFFVTLGVVFFVIICAGAYVWFADPFEIRPLISLIFSGPSSDVSDVPLQKKEGTTEVEEVLGDKNPALSPAQEEALEKIGIDPAKLPTSITPEMEKCFIEKLGTTRVKEIKSGSSPTPSEVFTTRSCFEQ